MNPFVIPEIAALKTRLSDRHYPLRRASELQTAFARIFSRHFGSLRGGRRFETECLLVTGPSGSGKTTEIADLLRRFNDSAVELPDSRPARIVECVLDAKGGWKDLGRKTLHAMGYPVAAGSRLTQTAIWERVVTQARLQGIVGIHYDEAQHILRGRSDAERLTILDAFKTLMKSHDWPLMLVLSGVPELAGYVKEEPQLHRLVTHIRFADIDLAPEADGSLAPDYATIHEIVGSYAMSAGVEAGEALRTQHFYHSLATAAAFRWGNLIKLTFDATALAAEAGTGALDPDHFIEVWVEKTGMNAAATPFTHEGYETLFRKDKPFQAAFET